MPPRPSATRKEYIARINRVIDHIEAHLDEPLRLETLAGVAHFSPYHFHRVFHAMVGETLNRFIQRVRCERAALKLVGNSLQSIGTVALDCGFSSSQSFARAFREQFGMSASAWREACLARDAGDISATVRKTGDASEKGSGDIAPGIHSPRSTIMSQRIMPTVTVNDFPETTVAYIRHIRHIGPYQADPELFGSLFGRLFQWAGRRPSWS